MRYTLPLLFTAAADAAGDEPAVFADGQYRSWAQWRAEADALARGLQDLGIGPGDVVAVHLPNCWDFLVAHIAIATAGAVMLPLHMGLGAGEIRSLLARTRAGTVVLAASRRHELIPELRTDLPALRRILVAGEADDAAGDGPSLRELTRQWAGATPSAVRVAPEDPFVLLPSSGTTSFRPKICVHTHHSLLANAVAVASDGEALGTDVIISGSLFTHLFGLLSVHISLVTRGRQALLRTWDVGEFRKLARDSAATVLFAVPAQIRDVVSGPGSSAETDGIRLREVRASGAVIPATLIESARDLLGARVIAQWGMSELGAGLYTRPGDPPEAATSSVGRPISGGQARVVDEDGSRCGPGETGELQFRSPFLFTGYFEDAELTRAALTADGWLRTGDRAGMNEDGTLAFRGRDAEVINVGGVKFSAPEIEALLDDLPGLGLIGVIGRPDDRLGEYPCLVVTLREGASVTLRDVRRHLAAKGVAEYKIPVELIVLDEMPCTPTGKIARKRLVATLDRATSHPRSPWCEQLRALSPAERLPPALHLVRDQIREMLGKTELIGPDQVFTDYGLTSLTAVRLRAGLVEATGLDLPTTVAFDQPTPNLLARHLTALVAGTPVTGTPVTGNQTGEGKDGAARTRSRPAEHDPVVVVGMGCRLPGGAASPAEFWDLLAAGGEAIGEFPADRGWDFGPDATYCRRGGFLPDAARFDPAFFGISPREAMTMDPQQRLLLETTWEAIEHARIDPVSLRDTETGVFVGMMASDYVPRTHESAIDSDGGAMTGNAGSVASGRISYVLGLRGPALTVDTACSSSLVALHLAARSLRDGECSLALVGGATVMSTPATFVEFARQDGLAADGRCKAFAAAADGTGWAEAVGVLVLERLSDARRAGHRVLGVIRGTAVNSDGTSNGLTAPNGPAQQRVIREALAAAGLEPSDVDVVEAHGTGTTLGDPIEAQAILATYGRDRERPLLLGSVKSNLGHAQAAAGVVGVIKTLMAISHAQVPKTLHVDQPSPHVDWTSGAVSLATEAVPWPETGRPRRAGVSAFGISGTNAHVILEQAPVQEDADVVHAPAPVVPLVFSASTRQALAAQAGRLLSVLAEGADPLDVGYSLATTRTGLEHRAVVLDAEGEGDGGNELAALAAGGGTAVTGRADLHGRIAFVFPGQGAQWAGMGAELLGCAPVFAASMAECEAALSEFVDWSLTEVLTDESAMERTEVVQPVLFAVMVSLARLWQSYGVTPDVVIGHSQGEIAAAYIAGVLSLRDAVLIVTRRGALCGSLTGGLMLSVESDEDVPHRISRHPGVCIAAHNGPSSTVLAGDAEAVTALAAEYQAADISVRIVPTGFASHSVHVEPLRDRLLADLADLRPQPARIPWHSTVTGRLMDGTQAGAHYWYDNLRQPVRLASTVETLAAAGVGYFVEVSPHSVLAAAIQETVGEAGLAVGTLRRGRGGIRRFAASLAQAYVRGLAVDWTKWFDDRGARQVDLPTYPFQRGHYWLSGPTQRNAAALGQQDVKHPMMAALVEHPGDDGVTFTGRISLTEPAWLTDHRVHGTVLVPGVALVELAIQLGDRFGCGRVNELVLHTPLVVPEEGGVQLQARVTKKDPERLTLTVHSRIEGSRIEGQESWTDHATGELVPDTVAAGSVAAGPEPVAWPPPGALPVDVHTVYQALLDAGVAHGPMFRGLRAVWRHDGDLFAEIMLPEGMSTGAFAVHPALLDAALHPIALIHAGTSGPLVPFSWRGVSLFATGATALRVRLRPGADGTGEVALDITDDRGLPVARVESLVCRPLTDDLPLVRAVAQDSLFRIRWTPTGPRSVDERELLDVSAVRDVRTALTRVLTALRAKTAEQAGLLVLTGHAVSTADGEDADPVQAAVWGLVRSAQRENPGLFILADSDDPPAFDRMVPVGEPEFAVRTGTAVVPRLARQAGGGRTTPANTDGTVLITGGTGGLGRLLARHLVERYDVRHLLLISRRGPDGPGADTIRDELTGLGALVRIVACDAGDRAALAEVLADIDPDHPLTGIVHTAGLLDDGVVGALTTGQVENVLRPKADAAWHLHELSHGHPVEMFVLFSSISGLLGGPGQANYGAANAYLDGLAARRRSRGLPAVSVAWGLWTRATGMTGALTAVDHGRISRNGIGALSDEEGLALFDAALTAGPALVAAMRVDVARIGSAPAAPVWSALVRPPSTRTVATAAAPVSLRRQLAGLDKAGQLRVIEDLVQARAAALLGHRDPSAVALDHKFLEIGFDSLSAKELHNALNQVTGLKLPPMAVFDAKTPAALAERVWSELLEQPTVGETQPTVGVPPYEESVRVVTRHAVEAGNPDAAFGLMRAVADLRPSFAAVADLGSFPAPTILADGPGRPRLIALSSPMANGGVHQHARLAAHFHGTMNITAVPLPGFVSGEKLPVSAEAAVAAVAESVHEASAGEPFVLLGYSSGGALAYAALRHLETSRRARPAGLIMIDTFRINDPAVPLDRVLREMFADEAGFGGITGDRLSAMGRWLATMSGMNFHPVDAPVLFIQATVPVESDAEDPSRWLAKPFERTHDLRTVRSDHFGLVGRDSAQTARVIGEWLDQRLGQGSWLPGNAYRAAEQLVL